MANTAKVAARVDIFRPGDLLGAITILPVLSEVPPAFMVTVLLSDHVHRMSTEISLC